MPAVGESVPCARRAVARYAQAVAALDADLLDAIRLAVSDAVANAALHAYPQRSGRVELTADMADGELWVLMADTGRGLNRPSDRAGLGMGLALMATVTGELVLADRADGGTEVG